MATASTISGSTKMRKDILKRIDPHHERIQELKGKLTDYEKMIYQLQEQKDDAIARYQRLKSVLEKSEKELLGIKHQRVSSDFLKVVSISNNRILPTQTFNHDVKLTPEDAKSLVLKELLKDFQTHLDQDMDARTKEILEIAAVAKGVNDDNKFSTLKQTFINLKTELVGLEDRLNLSSTNKPAESPRNKVIRVSKSVRSNVNLKQLGIDLEFLNSLDPGDCKKKKPHVVTQLEYDPNSINL